MAKNLIYQYWKVADGSRLGTHGNELPYTERVCMDLMQKYAKRIGVDYRFDSNPSFAIASDKWSSWVSKYYNCFEPCFNSDIYQDYDNILYVDCDVGVPFFINDNIFEAQGDNFDIAICREGEQEWTRRKQSIDGLSKEYNKLRKNTPDSLMIPLNQCIYNGTMLYWHIFIHRAQLTDELTALFLFKKPVQ